MVTKVRNKIPEATPDQPKIINDILISKADKMITYQTKEMKIFKMINSIRRVSPFKRVKLKWYFGEVSIGTPYFLPRRWIKDPLKPGYQIAVPKKIGFDFVKLGWKTKWSNTDFRFEWAPIWSFVLFKWQIAIIFQAPEQNHYWECWLYYTHATDKTKSIRERITQAREGFPCIWKSSTNGVEKSTCYWDIILKSKYCSENRV